MSGVAVSDDFDAVLGGGRMECRGLLKGGVRRCVVPGEKPFVSPSAATLNVRGVALLLRRAGCE